MSSDNAEAAPWDEKSHNSWDQYEGPSPSYSSLFFSSWISFVFLWRCWLLLESHHGMHTEFTRRVSSLDIVIAHIGICMSFIPMRFLYYAPTALYNGILVTMFVFYTIAFILFIIVLKLSSNKLNMLIAGVVYALYLCVYFGSNALANKIIQSGFPHCVWMFLNFTVILLIVFHERYRVAHSDPLDYNYTHDQKRRLRHFEGGMRADVSSRKVSSPSLEFGSAANAAAKMQKGGSGKSPNGGSRPFSMGRPKSTPKKYGGAYYNKH